jgi:hypothetical protein
MIRGELDARANIADTVLQRNPEFVDKGLMNFHAILEIPRGESIRTRSLASFPS